VCPLEHFIQKGLASENHPWARVDEGEGSRIHRGDFNYKSGVLQNREGFTPIFQRRGAGAVGRAVDPEDGMLLMNCSDDGADRLSDGVEDNPIAAFTNELFVANMASYAICSKFDFGDS
jgi:hypothetical protein